MKTYRATYKKSWARLPKKLPRNFFKTLDGKPCAAKDCCLKAVKGGRFCRVHGVIAWPQTRRFNLDEFKKKLDKVLKPMGFSAVSCEHDMRHYCISVQMRHVFPKQREYTQELPERTARLERHTIYDMPPVVVIDPEVWQCRYQISEEEFMHTDDHWYLLQHCCQYAVVELTRYQLSKMGA